MPPLRQRADTCAALLTAAPPHAMFGTANGQYAKQGAGAASLVACAYPTVFLPILGTRAIGNWVKNNSAEEDPEYAKLLLHLGDVDFEPRGTLRWLPLAFQKGALQHRVQNTRLEDLIV